MILPFSTQLNGKPTYFVERIHKCFSLKEVYMIAGLDPSVHYPKDYNFVAKDKLPAKLHTIRLDAKDRWKTGTMIDFFINCRQKDMFRFAPRIPVVSVQEVEIRYWADDCARILIDGKNFYGGFVNGQGINQQQEDNILQLAQNDGFDTIEDFFAYFNEDFKGKIIHWTNLKY